MRVPRGLPLPRRAGIQLAVPKPALRTGVLPVRNAMTAVYVGIWTMAALATATLVLAGCSANITINSGPLGGVGSHGIACGVAEPSSRVVTYAHEEFANASASLSAYGCGPGRG